MAGPDSRAAAEKLTTLGRSTFDYLAANAERLSETLYGLLLSWGATAYTLETVPLLTQTLASGDPAKGRAAVAAINKAEVLQPLFAETLNKMRIT